MVISREHEHHILYIGLENLIQVQHLKYLGAIISENGKPDKDLNSRISATGKFYHALKRNFIGKREPVNCDGMGM